MLKATTVLAGALTAAIATTAAAEGELNIYSSRHYDTDEQLYSDFEKATGITINRIEGNADELIARMNAEGENSPADILITVDTSRLTRAKEAGVLQSIDSDVLEARVPAYLQDQDNQWFGFSQRARIIFFDKDEVANPPQTYLDLADPAYKGQVCIRSSKNTYNQTLLASIVTHHGPEKAREWAEGVVANMARDPQGGDTDQMRGIISGECDIAVANSYYFARSIRKDVKGISENRDQIGWLFPSQNTEGAHMNLSGGGVAVHAPNKENAIKFLEYLSGDSAQAYFSAGNDEYPAVSGVGLAPSIAALGHFKPDDVNLSEVAKNLPEAQKIFNDAGWK
ncbi:Fe(3+) ABC transporter substrate-binding protein [Leisingera sp. SS27]|uniref:Fe(3+) ABC transporter substrate-binding protein n=1 Tax=Leisingera sp. SS27 TaxID=2979462 RepID=UPI00232D7C34|nr:Fe(3+) ABC transporter substrate-binding protein [Leisingera sp. SS27]MDC0659050.1 Fe(3+) ABC transporter substrate-binding protein [Leisingera sp. SS27]